MSLKSIIEGEATRRLREKEERLLAGYSGIPTATEMDERYRRLVYGTSPPGAIPPGTICIQPPHHRDDGPFIWDAAESRWKYAGSTETGRLSCRSLNEEENIMRPYRVTIIDTGDEKFEGAEILVEKTILAHRKTEANIKAARLVPNSHDDKIDDIAIYVEPVGEQLI